MSDSLIHCGGDQSLDFSCFPFLSEVLGLAVIPAKLPTSWLNWKQRLRIWSIGSESWNSKRCGSSRVLEMSPMTYRTTNILWVYSGSSCFLAPLRLKCRSFPMILPWPNFTVLLPGYLGWQCPEFSHVGWEFLEFVVSDWMPLETFSAKEHKVPENHWLCQFA